MLYQIVLCVSLDTCLFCVVKWRGREGREEEEEDKLDSWRSISFCLKV